MPELATIDKVRAIVDNWQFNTFIWPDEWKDENGQWWTPLPAGHGDPIPVDPLIIDATTANCMITVFDALNEKNQAKFTDWIARDRAHFGYIVELCWKVTKPKN